MTEFELIEKLIPRLPSNDAVVLSAGHDCAVLDLGNPDELHLFKTDAVVEGIHFTRETPSAKIGRKALARCLSDIAAAGGKPISALVTMGLPKPLDAEFVEGFYDGLIQLAKEFGVAISGGETTSSPDRVFISISLIGSVPRKQVIHRGGAKPGDGIFVTGELGGSLSGKHLDFVPRLREGAWLAREFPINAMMDLSDGIAGDLRHILNRSGVGAELHSASIPISKAAKMKAREESSAKPPLLAALTDGEDFELLFTTPAPAAVPLLDAWKKEFPDVKLTCIGRISAEQGLRLRDRNGIRTLGAHGYTHFDKS